MRTKIILLSLVVGLALVPTASASFISYTGLVSQPTICCGPYATGISTHLPFGVAPGVTFSSFTDTHLTVTSSVPLTARQVPSGWATWSSPPLSESATPLVAITGSAHSATLTLDRKAKLFGFELEPDLFQTFIFTVDFYHGATFLGQASTSVSGSSGARMFAGEMSGLGDLWFDKIVISGPDDFAIAQVHYAVPEPATLGLIGAGLLALGLCRRKSRHV